MRVLEAIGTILGYVVMAIWIVATTLVNLYVLARYGLFVWLFVIPISLMLIGLVFTLGMAAVAGLVTLIGMGVGALFGVGRGEPEG